MNNDSEGTELNDRHEAQIYACFADLFLNTVFGRDDQIDTDL